MRYLTLAALAAFLAAGCVEINPDLHPEAFDDYVGAPSHTAVPPAWGDVRTADRCINCDLCCGDDGADEPAPPPDADTRVYWGFMSPAGSVYADPSRWSGSRICHRYRDAYILACGTSYLGDLTCPWEVGEVPADFPACVDVDGCSHVAWGSSCEPAVDPVNVCAQYAALAAETCLASSVPACPFVDAPPFDWGACVLSYRTARGCLPDVDPVWLSAVCAAGS